MPISLYDAVVPGYSQAISAMLGLFGKAEAFLAERGLPEEEIAQARLAPDMLPMGYQVKSVANHSLGAIEGLRAGVFSPGRDPGPQTLAEQRALLEQTHSALAQVDAAELDAMVGRDMRFEMGEMRMPFDAEHFLLSFSVPNFYFHATTAYALLRMKGVPIGKRDFLGRPRVRM